MNSKGAEEATTDEEALDVAGVAPVAMDIGNPWDSAPQTASPPSAPAAPASSEQSSEKKTEAVAPAEDGGWANFDSI